MVTQADSLTFQYSHTIGRQETRSGDGFFYPVALARGEGDRLYVLSRGTETPVFWPCKRVTICTIVYGQGCNFAGQTLNTGKNLGRTPLKLGCGKIC